MEYSGPADSDMFMPMDPSNLEPADDMVKLGDLHEAALLHNVRLRFFDDDISTYIDPGGRQPVQAHQHLHAGVRGQVREEAGRHDAAAARLRPGVERVYLHDTGRELSVGRDQRRVRRGQDRGDEADAADSMLESSAGSLVSSAASPTPSKKRKKGAKKKKKTGPWAPEWAALDDGLGNLAAIRNDKLDQDFGDMMVDLIDAKHAKSPSAVASKIGHG
eukprot:COSAG02_NODE_25684_length_652_cov_0.716094_1_plen_217_part_11